ncbi:hypothetical protein [Bradyrhizobium yuanmingense]|uniref:hypothetical protein n=1 Tax=Bradyrhizobium yuanmingense TaxID=108015 RepID=UPI0023B9F97B|nr:hypothetical protein [Bradyrhizobium yuanmingense]MDF0579206.1 hypothetical protein [Bradyrhizobium yuanmingense]
MKWPTVFYALQAMTFQRGVAFENAQHARSKLHMDAAGDGGAADLRAHASAKILSSFPHVWMERMSSLRATFENPFH